MTEDEAYKVHIQYTFNAFCKIVIRHAAIDKILKLRRRWEREVSLDYLMNEKFVQLAEPEQLEEYLFTACGQTAVLYHAELAAALALLPEQAQEEIFRYYFLRQPQRGEHVGAVGFEVEGIDAAHGFRAARVVFERQQRGERSPPHGVERDVGIGQRADAQHPRHRLSDDQPFQIAQPHAPLPGGNGIAKLKDSPVGVVDAPDRGGGLTPSVFEQGALLQGERQRADPRDACEGRGVEIPLRKGLPLPRGDGKIGVESRIHRLDERFEAVEDRQQDDHGRNGHRHGRDAQSRDQVDHRPGLGRKEVATGEELRQHGGRRIRA